MASARRATGTATSSVRKAVPDGPQRARGWRQALAQLPQVRALGLVAAEPRGGPGGRRTGAPRRPVRLHGPSRLVVLGAELGEEGRGPRRDREGIARARRQGAQAVRVEDLERRPPPPPPAASPPRPPPRSSAKKTRPVARLGGSGTVRRVTPARKPERALRPHHEVGQDVRGRVVVEEGVEAVADGVLGLELPAHARGQGGVARASRRAGRGGPRGGRAARGAAARRRRRGRCPPPSRPPACNSRASRVW